MKDAFCQACATAFDVASADRVDTDAYGAKGGPRVSR